MTSRIPGDHLLQRLFNESGGNISRMRETLARATEDRSKDTTVSLGTLESGGLDIRVARCLDDVTLIREVTFDWDDRAVNRGTHARRSPAVTILIETGATVVIQATHHALARPTIVIGTREGHRRRLDAMADRTLLAWRRLQAEAMTAILGHTSPEWVEPQRGLMSRISGMWRTPPPRPGHDDHLAHAIADRILDREPSATSSITYLEDVSGDTGWKNGKPNIEAYKSDWLAIGDGIRILRSGAFKSVWRDHDSYMVAHPGWGVTFVPSGPILAAIGQRRDAAFQRALPNRGRASSDEAIGGNAAAASLQRRCRQALARNPHLASSDGGRIDRMAEEHLPRLVALHDAAVRNATAEQVRQLDRELREGIAIAEHALDDALSAGKDNPIDTFRDELRFFAMRHPTASRKD